MGLGGEDFAYVVGDEEYWSSGALAPQFQVAYYVIAEVGLESGERLVEHQQTAGSGGNGAGESNALAFAA